MAIEDNPKVWRLRAEEARTTGDNMRDRIARQMMYEVAQTYDKLAERSERLAGRTAIFATPTGPRSRWEA